MIHPTPNGLVGHRHSAFRQQIFDVAQAEGEPKIEPYSLVNDLRRETISAVADFLHPLGYSATGRTASPTRRDNANADVRVLTQPPVRELTDSAFYSGIVLFAALALRAVGQYATGRGTLEGIAGLTTAGAALYHGLVDYRLRGNIDPEVLTVTYLLIALVRGNALPAATLTWVSTFGRHLVRMPPRGIVVRPAETGLGGRSPYLEVLIAPDPTPPDKMTFFGMIPTMALQAMTGEPGRHDSFIHDIRQIAATHNQVLEGVSDFRRGIRLRIRDTLNALPEQ